MQNNDPTPRPSLDGIIKRNVELLTRREAASYLGIAEQTLAAWASAGRYALPMVRVGRLVRYRQTDLDAWLAKRTTSGAE